MTKKIADVLLIFIIFDGGFRITKKAFTSVVGPSLTLATLGVALTAGILGVAIHFIFNFDIVYSLVISSIISSTDAAAVFMITKANPIKNNLATTLNIESAANDPMAIILTITFIQIATGSFNSPFLAVVKLICGSLPAELFQDTYATDYHLLCSTSSIQILAEITAFFS